MSAKGSRPQAVNYKCFYKFSSRKRTPSEGKKGVRTCSWPLTGCKNTEFIWELRKTGFCEGGRKKSCPLTIVPTLSLGGRRRGGR